MKAPTEGQEEDVDREDAWWADYHGVEGDGVPGTAVPRTPSPTPTLTDMLASGKVWPPVASPPESPRPFFELESP